MYPAICCAAEEPNWGCCCWGGSCGGCGCCCRRGLRPCCWLYDDEGGRCFLPLSPSSLFITSVAARSLYYSLVPILSLSMLVASIHYYRPITHNNRDEASIISSTEHSIFLNSKENEALNRQTAEVHLRALMRLTKLPKNSY